MNHFGNKRLSDSQDLFLEALKNRFLAAIYSKDPEQTRQVYLQISAHARHGLPYPGETREKYYGRFRPLFFDSTNLSHPPLSIFRPRFKN